MSMDVFQGKWEQLKGAVRTQWGKLTDDDVQRVGGKKDELIGRLRERYGYAKDDASKQIDDWLRGHDKDQDGERRA
jgi:uncharacterized protein YjbJ (UPF0337 family)